MPRKISLRKSSKAKAVSAKKSSIEKKPKKLSLRRFKINFRSLKLWIWVMLVLAVALLGAAGYLWYTKIFTNPDRIFYGMLAKSLETDSVSREVSQTASGRSEVQDYYLAFSPTPLVHSKSTVEQVDQARNKTTVQTETIGTKDADYVRYTNIDVPKNSTDKTDYSKVTNIWAKKDSNKAAGQNTQFLNEAIFTFIPFGNFNQDQRSELLQMIREKEVYKLGPDGKVRYDNLRPVYSTTLYIKPRGLVEVLKKYAEETGIGDMAQLNPSQYDDKYSFSVQIEVDMISRHLKLIAYPGETRKEVYQSYGLNRNIEVPEQTISVEELQSKLQ